ncbi:hypothetical protein BDW69DRAFT_187577 [Aspergillus filifer]
MDLSDFWTLSEMWIGDRFEDHVFLGPNGSEWRIAKKLSERAISSQPLAYELGEDTSEAQAVFQVQQVHGPCVGEKAMLKVRMQIPEGFEDNVSSDPEVRAQYASETPSAWTIQEFQTLSWLTQRGCSVTPRLLHTMNLGQDDDTMPVPGGWLVCMLMEMVPGVPMTEFCYYNRAQRDKIRQAFLRSMTELCSYNVMHFDNGPQNILYDEEQDKIYFVDFEDSYVNTTATKPMSTLFENEDMVKGELQLWGLDDEMLGLAEPMDHEVQQDRLFHQEAANPVDVDQSGSLTAVY